MYNYRGIRNIERNDPGQIEFNRRKNVEQDQKISSLSSQLAELISQKPSGFLPKVYYGLTRGDQKYRFLANAVITVSGLPGSSGDAYEILSPLESSSYVSAIAVNIGNNQIKIAIQGDYNSDSSNFTLVNMVTGATLSVSLGDVLSLQDASYLGSYNAQDNEGAQITVLYDLESNQENVIFASVDFNMDGTYNWVMIGGYQNGINGHSIYSVNSSNIATTLLVAKAEDSLLACESFTHDGASLTLGTVYRINQLSPLGITAIGNIRGATGEQGEQGVPGNDGVDGATPEIIDNYWWVAGENTGVIAVGQNGTNGTNGQSFQMQSGLYSTPDNYGETGNTDPDGNPLLELPTLPTTGVSGKGYIVFDPLTTPLEPFYDLYYANDNDNDWTIMHPFSGLKGQDGTNGYTPYIQNGTWYINGVSTGVSAVGQQGAPGAKGCNPRGAWEEEKIYAVDDVVTYGGSAYICIQAHTGRNTAPSSDTLYWTLFVSKGDKGDTGNTGATGLTGATPSISMTASQLPAGSSPTVTKSGTDANPIFALGIPKGDTGATGVGVPTGGTSGQYLKKNSSTNYDTGWESPDTTVTENSTKLVTSGAVHNAIQNSGTVSAGTTVTGKNDTVTEYYVSSDNKTWYRKWASGWKECGGYASGADIRNDYTVVLPITFTNSNYKVQITNIWAASYGAFNYWSVGSQSDQTTTQFVATGQKLNTNAPNTAPFYWEAKGY